MTDLTIPCRYKSFVDEKYICIRPVERDGLCIFHTPKCTKEQKEGMPDNDLKIEKLLEDRFREELVAMLERMEKGPREASLKLVGFRFPSFKFTEHLFRAVYLIDADFYDDVDFSHINFNENAIFTHATFKGNVNFSHSSFVGQANFQGARFENGLFSADFTGSEFRNDAIFTNAIFGCFTSFAGASFAKDRSATFTFSKFQDVVTFADSEFNGWVFLNNVSFSKEVHFTLAKFQCRVDFQRSTFSKDEKAHFNRATFNEVDFTGIKFYDTDFSHATFNEGASYTAAVFNNEAQFGEVTFKSVVRFSGAKFLQGANFVHTIFNDSVDFSDAVYNNEIVFIGGMRRAFFAGEEDTSMGFRDQCHFRRILLLEEAEVLFEKVNLGRATFLDTNIEDFRFRDVTWHQEESRLKRWPRKLIARWVRWKLKLPPQPNDHRKLEGYSIAHLRTVRKYLIQEINKAKDKRDRYTQALTATGDTKTNQYLPVKFISIISPKNNIWRLLKILAVIDLVQFEAYKAFFDLWFSDDFRWSKGLTRRRTLWHEFYLLPDEGEFRYERIAENYRQLVINFERNRDYGAAEDFHVGEMEMQRKAKKQQAAYWKGLNTYDVYKFTSKYGTSFWRALAVFLLLFALFSLAFMYSGIQSKPQTAGVSEYRINYTLVPSANDVSAPFSQWLSDYGQSSLYTLTIIGFQKGEYYEPTSKLSKFWVSAAIIVLASQAALFLLAIRRRFRR